MAIVIAELSAEGSCDVDAEPRTSQFGALLRGNLAKPRSAAVEIVGCEIYRSGEPAEFFKIRHLVRNGTQVKMLSPAEPWRRQLMRCHLGR